jgi:hypothetical protein
MGRGDLGDRIERLIAPDMIVVVVMVTSPAVREAAPVVGVGTD